MRQNPTTGVGQYANFLPEGNSMNAREALQQQVDFRRDALAEELLKTGIEYVGDSALWEEMATAAVKAATIIHPDLPDEEPTGT